MATGNEPSISEILVRARSGDAVAQNELFDACRNYLQFAARASVESWLKAKVDVSDVVQQTLLEAHRDFKRFEGGTHAEWLAWLRKILAHNAADFVRQYRGTEKRQQRREVPLHPHRPGEDSRRGFDPCDPGESPSQQLMRRERELAIADALALLSPDHREVVVLRNLQRLSFNEVAERMGRTRPATQMLWMRAIKKLQEILEGSNVSTGSV